MIFFAEMLVIKLVWHCFLTAAWSVDEDVHGLSEFHHLWIYIHSFCLVVEVLTVY